VNLIETTETHWKYRIYLIDIGSSVHDILKNESDEVYYKLLQLKVEPSCVYYRQILSTGCGFASLENRLKKKYVRK
jgi:hypothetical protein